MSGLDRVPYARFLGLEGREIDGESVIVMPFREALVGNPMLPALHGGAVAAMMELTAIARLAGKSPETPLPRPINVTVSYLRSGRALDTIAAARISRAGRRVVNVLVEAWQADREQPIAALSAHFLLHP